MYSGLYKDLNQLQNIKEKELDEETSVKVDERKGELCVWKLEQFILVLVLMIMSNLVHSSSPAEA